MDEPPILKLDEYLLEYICDFVLSGQNEVSVDLDDEGIQYRHGLTKDIVHYQAIKQTCRELRRSCSRLKPRRNLYIHAYSPDARLLTNWDQVLSNFFDRSAGLLSQIQRVVLLLGDCELGDGELKGRFTLQWESLRQLQERLLPSTILELDLIPTRSAITRPTLLRIPFVVSEGDRVISNKISFIQESEPEAGTALSLFWSNCKKEFPRYGEIPSGLDYKRSIPVAYDYDLEHWKTLCCTVFVEEKHEYRSGESILPCRTVASIFQGLDQLLGVQYNKITITGNRFHVPIVFQIARGTAQKSDVELQRGRYELLCAAGMCQSITLVVQ